MNDDLTRMVLNPDVTVTQPRCDGKMFFLRTALQEGKLKAKKENRVLEDGECKNRL